MKTTFFLPKVSNIDELSNISIDKEWQVLRNGQRWTLQTYLRLKEAGVDVDISNRLPDEGMVVFQARHKRDVKRELISQRKKDVITVSMRGDKSEALIADFELVQNNKWVDENRRFFIPYWPQPGLIPRNTARGSDIVNISFKGFSINLDSYFMEQDWIDWLSEQAMVWAPHVMEFYDSEESGVLVNWHDYSDIDIVLAIRPIGRRNHQLNGWTTKPASKLINAWHAGVPAILSPDYAFMSERKSKLDFLIAGTPAKARETLSLLKENPNLYSDMVENGLERAKEFTVEEISSKWRNFLEEVPLLTSSGKFEMMHNLPPVLRIAVRRFNRYLRGIPKR